MKFISALILFIGLLSCSSETGSTLKGNDVTSNRTDIKKPVVVTKDIPIEFAQNFMLHAIPNGYRLELIDPNSQEIELSYELTYDTEKKGDNIIHIPITNIAALSQTTVGMISSLGALDDLTGILNIDYVYDPTVKKLFSNGKITEFKDETNFPIETAVQAKTEVIIYSGFGKEFPQEKKLQKFGIKAIPNYDWRETHPLGRAEWIKFVGVLCGKVEEAEKTFNVIKKEYEDLRWKIRKLEDTPTVLSGNFWGDQWTAPAGESYMAILISDARGDYMYKRSAGTGSIFLSMESVIMKNEKTKIWINPGFNTKEKIVAGNPKGQHVGPFKGKPGTGIYCYSHEMNKFWERGALEPHHILSDLIHVFHPEFEPDSELYFYQKL
ncbi:MAG: iron complex transport system substrate-binding protein [Crocinitomicaceae bacterium]|jgi:iron complex transport system substrate-binding protein